MANTENIITISADRYEELVRHEAELNVINNLYHSNIDTYRYNDFMRLIFGERSNENA